MLDGPLTLRATPLEPGAFAAFGEVIEHRGSERRHVLGAAFASSEQPVRQTLWVSRLEQNATMPLTIDMLERHPHSDQAFVPLSGQPYLIVVCGSAADGSADVAEARAFVAGPNQGVLYRRNVWHLGLTVLAAPAEFVVVIGKAGAPDDDVFQRLTRPIRVLPPVAPAGAAS